jgi:hypothetical protein
LIDSGASHDGVDMATMREHRGYPKWSCDWYGWEDFGDLMHGGNPCQPSSLIYDWPYIMWLQYARSGDERFRMLAEEMTDHSRDMDQHHNENDAGQGTVANIADGIWNWENGKFRGHHINFNSAGNIVSHTWNGGYALGYLLTGNPTYLEAARRSAMAGWRFWFLYKKVDKGPVKYDQTRSQGWTILMLVNLYRITGERDLLEKAMQVFTNSLLYTEQLPDPPGSGGKGYISVGEYYDKSYIGKVVATFATYHLEPLIELHVEAVRVGIPVDGLERFLFRSVDWLKNYAYVGGKALGPRKYVPLMLSYSTDPVNRTANKGAYVTMNGFVASASAYASLLLKDKDPARAQTYLDFARRLFKDLMFYMDFRGHPSDGSIDPTLRSKIWWLSVYGVGPKVMGWIGRGGQPYLYVESIQAAPGRADN